MRKIYNKEKRIKYAQNYIKNPALVRRLLKGLNLNTDDCVLEIGPGEGIFSAEILKSAGKLLSVEIDKENIANLNKKFAKEIKGGAFVLYHKDALLFDKKFEFKKHSCKSHKIVASIPYNISSQIFKKYLLKKPLPKEAYFVVQKEFAKRVMSEGELLPTLLQSFYDIQVLYEFEKRDFSPAPSVDSVFMILKLKENIPEIIMSNFGDYKAFVSKAYTQPIKSVQVFLKNFINPDKVQSLLDKRKIKRKEKVTELSSEDLVALSEFVFKLKS